ncbi:class I SAM-dependent methyltransferase [Stenomitos frigidus]|uniref:Class I SAM-dependent methyltransferase n=1 Tax=Stenomitos frigidus ULC18 TaxID=2107698 RepID=A0A2T1DTF3_9CYAN|nr:class I SAM-dependent methyltransferase [Stenomitos frigidus]PSB23796.1 class I SAM-dependent methyltransferase [Stenomitos frigidus ULC18]
MTESTHSHSSGHDWATYYQAVEGRPPRETLLKALTNFDAEPLLDRPRFAVDLGCGDGRDTVELLRRNWRVLAVDGEQKAFDRLLDRPDLQRDLLQTQLMRFENLALPSGIDLINASFCLPFCLPTAFPKLWETIVASLNPCGRFCGQLFGDRDSWAIYPNRTHHTRQQVEALLQPFETEWLEEEEHPGVTAIGEQKHWHIFHVVARERG